MRNSNGSSGNSKLIANGGAVVVAIFAIVCFLMLLVRSPSVRIGIMICGFVVWVAYFGYSIWDHLFRKKD